MNRYDWNNPPPPGTEFDSPDEDAIISSHKNVSPESRDQVSNIVDTPSVKSPVSQVQEEEKPPEIAPVRSRSKSPDRRKRPRRSKSRSRRSRSNSRGRRRRSRSRSRRRRRKHSSSRSRSRSRSSSYRRRNRRHHRRHSRSRSRSQTRKTKSYRSRSGSRSHSRSRSYRSERDRRSPRAQRIDERRESNYTDKELDGDIIEEEDMKIDDLEEEVPVELEPDQGPIPFKNDGSFLEMFKRMQELQKATDETAAEASIKKPILPTFGKRRGGKVLKTGMVAKVKNKEEEGPGAQDAWSVYMTEVRKYKEVHCDDDSKTRPLVK